MRPLSDMRHLYIQKNIPSVKQLWKTDEKLFSGAFVSQVRRGALVCL